MNEDLLRSVYALPKIDISVVAKDFMALVYQVVDAMPSVAQPQ